MTIHTNRIAAAVAAIMIAASSMAAIIHVPASGTTAIALATVASPALV